MSRMFITGFAALMVTASAPGQEAGFPEDLVRWVPIEANPVFRGAGGGEWDSAIRERGWILFDDGIYRLWYTGYDGQRSSTKHLGHATSPDGIEWTRDPRNPIHDGTWVEDVQVLKHEGTYFLFAEGEQDIAHLMTSADGIRWEERGPLDIRRSGGEPIEPGPRGTPSVVIRDGTWYLFYERRDQGIWLATSDDLQVWTNIQDDPVIALGPDPYDATAIALNQVVERDGVFYALYHANAHYPAADWTTCVARSTDLVRWEKYPGNPILRDNSSSGILVEGPEGTFLYSMHPEVRRHVNPDGPGE